MDRLVRLRGRCLRDAAAPDAEQVFLAGLSMGAALCLRLAEQHGADVSGLTLVNPVVNISDPRVYRAALPVLRHDSLARRARQ